MAWYWWILIAVSIFSLIGMIRSHNEAVVYEEETEDAMNRLSAIVILDSLKYTHPGVWAKCVSDIIGRPVDPPTPEQIEKWKIQKWEREMKEEAKRDAEEFRGMYIR